MAEPLQSWLTERGAGVLLHPTSLPGSGGIGTLDEHATAFIDYLADSGFKDWQTYALFSALKAHFKGQPWWEWPAAARDPVIARKSALARQLAERVDAYSFIQYLFFGQWSQLRAYAKKRAIELIGDTPIFAALDSA